MSDIYQQIGLRIRHHRKRLGWTQEELGERCRMHPAYIGQIERGVKKISIAALQRLSKALAVPTSELFDETARYPTADWKSKIGGLLRDRPERELRVLYTTLRHLAKEMRRERNN